MPNIGNQLPYEQHKSLKALCEKALGRIENPVAGELGSWTGKSTILIANILKPLNGILYTIDWFEGSEGTALMQIAREYDILSVLRTNLKIANVDNVNILCMSSEDAARIIKDEIFDLFFIDADHRYTHIKHDIELWLPKVKKDGLLCGHDFRIPTWESELDLTIEKYDEIDYIGGNLNLHPRVTKAVCEMFEREKINYKENIWGVMK